jgi:hypothetical protein
MVATQTTRGESLRQVIGFLRACRDGRGHTTAVKLWHLFAKAGAGVMCYEPELRADRTNGLVPHYGRKRAMGGVGAPMVTSNPERGLERGFWRGKSDTTLGEIYVETGVGSSAR